MFSQEKQWERLLAIISDNFADGEKIDLLGVLFLVGVQELGKGPKAFGKQEKLDLLHVAICKLLSRWGYYLSQGVDADGWPVWEKNPEKQVPDEEVKNDLLQKSLLLYFEEQGVFNPDDLSGNLVAIGQL